MRGKGLGWILRELAGDRQAVAVKSGEEMDVDEPQLVKIPKMGTIMPGSTVQPKTRDRSRSHVILSRRSEEAARGKERNCTDL